jgi:hypothetical protein
MCLPRHRKRKKRHSADLRTAAQRALKVAEDRRKQIDAKQAAMAEKVDGCGGLNPKRYDDWEIKRLTINF